MRTCPQCSFVEVDAKDERAPRAAPSPPSPPPADPRGPGQARAQGLSCVRHHAAVALRVVVLPGGSVRAVLLAGLVALPDAVVRFARPLLVERAAVAEMECWSPPSRPETIGADPRSFFAFP